MALLEEVVHRRGSEVSTAQATPNGADSSLLLPWDQDLELSALSPIPCLPGLEHPTMMIMDRTSEPVSQPQSNVVLY